MLYAPSYDPLKTFEENYASGPFGEVLKINYEKPATPARKKFLGHHVHSDFGVPAGPIFNSNYARAYFDAGFDILVYKTVRSEERKCNPFPNVVPIKVSGNLTPEIASRGLVTTDSFMEPLSITNSFGVPSVRPDVWLPDMKKAIGLAHEGQILVGAFQGTNHGKGESDIIRDHVATARMVKETGVKVMEVNTSCPNEGASHLLCYDIPRMEKIIHAIKSEIGSTSLIVKIGFYEKHHDLEGLISKIGSVADAIAAINTISGKIVSQDGSQALTGEGRATSGVCGAGIKWAGIDMVKRLKELRDTLGMKFTIVGVGGVMNADDYLEYKEAGADAVMSATGAMWNPYLAQEIKTRFPNRHGK